MKSVTIPLLLLSATFAVQLPAQPAAIPATPPKREASINPGDLAPELKVVEWVKGSPITRFEPGKVYIVEFWATWCGPCIENIPYLNALQKKYGKDGLVVIGMTSPDLAADYQGGRKEDNTLQKVRDFVAKQDWKMEYHVAYDTPMRETYKSMMGSIGGIPYAFIIGRDGRLVLSGHPFWLADAVAKIVAGTWNYERDYPEIDRSHKLYKALGSANGYEAFQAAFVALEKDFPEIAKKLLRDKFSKALKAGDSPSILAAGREMMNWARESGISIELASSAYATACDLAVIQRSSVLALADAQRFNQVKTLVYEMAACAATVSRETDATALSAQAELAYGVDDLVAAVEFQKKAVAASLSPYNQDLKQKRCAEFEGALAEKERLAAYRAASK